MNDSCSNLILPGCHDFSLTLPKKRGRQKNIKKRTNQPTTFSTWKPKKNSLQLYPG